MKIDHTEKTELMLYQFQDSPVLGSYTTSVLSELNELEDLSEKLLLQRSIDTAVGVQLDQVGLLVGEIRNGRSDADFRQAIKLRIAINTSRGTVEDIIQVINLLYGDDTEVIVTRTGKALLSIYIGIEQPTEDLIPLLQQTVSAGVKIGEIIYPSTRLPWIPTERGGLVTDTGILPEIGDDSPTIRIPPERIGTF